MTSPIEKRLRGKNSCTGFWKIVIFSTPNDKLKLCKYFFFVKEVNLTVKKIQLTIFTSFWNI